MDDATPLPSSTFDPSADAVYLRLAPPAHPGGVVASARLTDPQGERLGTVDFDADGRVLGIEIIGARRLLHPELLDAATLLPD